MEHIVILAHFICVTIGAVLLWELLRGIEKINKNLFVIGIACSDVFFALDTFCIYVRYWWKDFPYAEITNLTCVILFVISVAFIMLHVSVGIKEKTLNLDCKYITLSIFIIICFVLQWISIYVSTLRKIPWACIEYIFFCIVEIVYIRKRSSTSLDGCINNDENKSGSDDNILMYDGLTKREQEIAECICQGLSNKEIAEKLVISQNTVRNHIYNLYRKTEVKNKVEFVNKMRK